VVVPEAVEETLMKAIRTREVEVMLTGQSIKIMMQFVDFILFNVISDLIPQLWREQPKQPVNWNHQVGFTFYFIIYDLQYLSLQQMQRRPWSSRNCKK